MAPTYTFSSADSDPSSGAMPSSLGPSGEHRRVAVFVPTLAFGGVERVMAPRHGRVRGMGSIVRAELERRRLGIQCSVLVEVLRMVQVNAAQHDRAILHADGKRDEAAQSRRLFKHSPDAVRRIEQARRPEIIQSVRELSFGAGGDGKAAECVPRSGEFCRSRKAAAGIGVAEFGDDLDDRSVVLSALARDAAEGVADWQRAIDETYRVLKPGGLFFTSSFMTNTWGCNPGIFSGHS